MLDVLEKFIFTNFRGMPKWVRVSTYLFMVLLFAYLLLLPRFIDGQLVAVDGKTSGFVPYRGVELQMQVDGRDYKFRSNENGYWSVPVVSRLPGDVELQVYHEDKAQWFQLKFTAAQIWKGRAHRVEISGDAPFVKLAEAPAPLAALLPSAHASLILPPGDVAAPPKPVPAAVPDLKDFEREVAAAASAVLGAKVGGELLLKGSTAPTYLQRIQLIERLEKKYGFSIPDEHWRSMSTGTELADYLRKRQLLNQSNPQLTRDPKASWPAIQQSFPPEQRPVFVPK
jgi:hypothetical protein